MMHMAYLMPVSYTHLIQLIVVDPANNWSTEVKAVEAGIDGYWGVGLTASKDGKLYTRQGWHLISQKERLVIIPGNITSDELDMYLSHHHVPCLLYTSRCV